MINKQYPKEVKRNKVGGTRSLIIDIIENQPRTIREISASLGFSKTIIRYHIKELESQNKVLFQNGLVKLKG